MISLDSVIVSLKRPLNYSYVSVPYQFSADLEFILGLVAQKFTGSPEVQLLDSFLKLSVIC